jgi:hypothetical protein
MPWPASGTMTCDSPSRQRSSSAVTGKHLFGEAAGLEDVLNAA